MMMIAAWKSLHFIAYALVVAAFLINFNHPLNFAKSYQGNTHPV